MQNTDKTPAISLNWIVVLRVMMGLVFLTTWINNWSKGLYGDGYLSFIQGWADGTELRWYASFMYSVVIPNIEILRLVQIVTELVFMGVFLIFGLLTPLSAAIAGVFVVNLGLASFGTGEWPWTYVMMATMLAIIMLTRAGRSYGLDGWMVEKRGEPPVPYLW